MRDLLASKNFSLICAIVNGVWAFNSFMLGSYGFGLLGLGFCALCTKNYMEGIEK